MTGFPFGAHGVFAVQAAAWLSCGALIGACYFLTLRWNVRLFALGRAPLVALALQFGRFALLAVVLAVIASGFGALPLLLAAAGVLAARTAAVRMGEQT